MKVESKSLDGLRGFAAFHVALGHCLYSSTSTDLMGECAIVIFFLISGFVMVVGYGQKKYSDSGGIYGEVVCVNLDRLNLCGTKALASSQADPAEQADKQADDENQIAKAELVPGISFPTYNFLVKRFARLGPMYYIATIMAIPLCFLIHMGTAEIVYLNVLSFLCLTSWAGFYPMNYALWTISTMSFFYLCYPCLIVRLQKLTTLSEFVALFWRMFYLQVATSFFFLVLFMLIDPNPLIWYTVWRMFPPNRLPIFIMGMCIGLMRVMPSADQNNLPTIVFAKHDVYAPALLYGAVVVFGIILSQTSSDETVLIARSILEVLMPLVFFDWMTELTRSKEEGAYTLLERFLRSDAMQFMGKISMSFYMLHALVLYYVGVMWYHSTHDNESNVVDQESKIDIPWWAVFVVLIVDIALGAFFTFYVELPLHDYIIANYVAKPKADGNGGDVNSSGGVNKGVSGGTTVVAVVETQEMHTDTAYVQSDSSSEYSGNKGSVVKKQKTANPLHKPLLDDIFPI